MKRVLVTGANGLLGQKVVHLLADRKAVEVLATGRGPCRIPDTTGFTYQSLDLTDHAELKRSVEAFQPTEVIHCAAMTQVDHCELDPKACQAHNVDAVQALVDYIKPMGTRLLHLSTDFIFDGTSGPYKETDVPNPLSVYGHSKLKAEQLIVASGIPNAILRTVLIYGVVPDLSRTNIVLWLKKTLEARQTAKVVDDQWRTPTLAEDLAEGVIATLMREKTGIYHLSGAELFSILEMAYVVADFWGLDKNLIEPVSSATLNQPAKRPPKTGFLILKAQSELDYRPHTLRQGLQIVNDQLTDYSS